MAAACFGIRLIAAAERERPGCGLLPDSLSSRRPMLVGDLLRIQPRDSIVFAASAAVPRAYPLAAAGLRPPTPPSPAAPIARRGLRFPARARCAPNPCLSTASKRSFARSQGPPDASTSMLHRQREAAANSCADGHIPVAVPVARDAGCDPPDALSRGAGRYRGICRPSARARPVGNAAPLPCMLHGKARP